MELQRAVANATLRATWPVHWSPRSRRTDPRSLIYARLGNYCATSANTTGTRPWELPSTSCHARSCDRGSFVSLVGRNSTRPKFPHDSWSLGKVKRQTRVPGPSFDPGSH